MKQIWEIYKIYNNMKMQKYRKCDIIQKSGNLENIYKATIDIYIYQRYTNILKRH